MAHTTEQQPGVRSWADESLAAIELARRAGELLTDLRSRSLRTRQALADEGDRLSHQYLMDQLTSWFPDDRVRSEEGLDAPGLPRLWVVDPLDGSREYGEGRDDWAVHVALVVDGHPVVGAVALSARGLVLATAVPPPLAGPAAVPRLVVSRSRPPGVAVELADRLGATTVPLGSAGVKIAAVVQGEADVYVHAGGQYEWDSAAPVAVALATGLHASRLDGSPLQYGQADPWLPDLLVCHPALAATALAALAELAPERP